MHFGFMVGRMCFALKILNDWIHSAAWHHWIFMPVRVCMRVKAFRPDSLSICFNYCDKNELLGNSSSKCGEGEVIFPVHIEHQLKEELTWKKCAQTHRLNQHNLKWWIFDAVTLMASDVIQEYWSFIYRRERFKIRVGGGRWAPCQPLDCSKG